MTAPWQPRQILLVLDGPDGQYGLVTCVGGGLGIMRDGVPIPECRWRDDQSIECIEELVRRCGMDRSH